MRNLGLQPHFNTPATDFSKSWSTEIEAASKNLFAAAFELGIGPLSKPMISASIVSGPNEREWLHANSRGAWLFLHRDPYTALDQGIWVAVQHWIATQGRNDDPLIH